MSVHMWEGGGWHVRWVSPAAVHTWDSSGLQVPLPVPLLYLLLILSAIRLFLFFSHLCSEAANPDIFFSEEIFSLFECIYFLVIFYYEVFWKSWLLCISLFSVFILNTYLFMLLNVWIFYWFFKDQFSMTIPQHIALGIARLLYVWLYFKPWRESGHSTRRRCNGKSLCWLPVTNSFMRGVSRHLGNQVDLSPFETLLMVFG